ncbi:hypothetical protein [Oceanobacillus damuensis]|uniref:hypothetical protein n=1 Tax=Oceanobacillus damuensis TaxID=937928 RepID=UPI0008346151|nr:hypothetical protein [Oceanobacillus damuensis]
MNRELTEIIFLLDRSGSMAGLEKDTIGGFNSMIKQQQETYHWEFIFLGANIDAVKEADRIGISEESAYEFEASEEGVEKLYSMVNEEITERRTINK